MGRDKALVEIDGVTLAERVATACRDAGCEPVLAVGGDADALAEVGLEPVSDEHPGEGPLGAILTALGAAPAGAVVFVVAVDVPGISPSAIGRVLAALAHDPDADVAVPRDDDGRRHHLHAAWRQRARAPLAEAFQRGERAPRRALGGLSVVDVVGFDRAELQDVDTPVDLDRWREERG